MSLINQMLKDLDARRGPASGAQVAALQGIGLVQVKRFSWRTGFWFVVLMAAAVVVLAAGYKGGDWWIESRPHADPSTAVTSAEPAHPSSSEPAPEIVAAAPQSPTAVVEAQSPAKPAPGPPPQRAEATRGTPAPHTAGTQTSIATVAIPEPVRNRRAPVTTLSPEEKAQRLHAQAQRALAENHRGAARHLLEQTLHEDPYHLQGRLQLATLFIDGGNRADAEEVLAAGLRLHPRRTELVRPYAQLLAERGSFSEALRVLDSAGAGDDADAETLAVKAAILYRLGQFRDASSAYRLALENDPGRGLWWVGLAVASENHDRRAALEAYRRAAGLKLAPRLRDYAEQRMAALESHYRSNGD
jgi:Tfp pilus assembly protein PilF